MVREVLGGIIWNGFKWMTDEVWNGITGWSSALRVGSCGWLTACSTFSSPEPLVPLSRLGLVHEEQVALRTHDLIG